MKVNMIFSGYNIVREAAERTFVHGRGGLASAPRVRAVQGAAQLISTATYSERNSLSFF